MMNETTCDVVVIGGGLSGLSAAYKLYKEFNGKFKIVVLEARDQVGGRLKNETLPAASGYDVWDVGGQWVCQSQQRVLRLLEEMKMETFNQYTEGENLVFCKHADDIRKYKGLIPPVGVFNLINYSLIERKINKMSAEVGKTDSFKNPQLAKWDSMTLQSFSDQNSYSDGVSSLFSCMTRVVFGCEPSQISLLFFLYVCASANGVTKLLETVEGSAQELRVKETAAELPKRLARIIGLQNVHCNSPVTLIDQTNEEHGVVHTTDGRKWKSKHIIAAIPPQLINQINFIPSLPHDKFQLNIRMPMGHLIKFIATYKTAFWKENSFSGESTVLTEQFTKETFCCTFDGTTSRENPAIVGFIGGENATYWSQQTVLDREHAVINRLTSLYGTQASTELIYYYDLDWSTQEYVGGCPVAAAQTGAFSYFHNALRRPFIRTHWAGTETSQEWTGYMEGAIEAGERAAEEVATSEKMKKGKKQSEQKIKKSTVDETEWKVSAKKASGRKWSHYLVGASLLVAATLVTCKKLGYTPPCLMGTKTKWSTFWLNKMAFLKDGSNLL